LAEGRAAYTTIVVRGEFVSDRTTIAGYAINTIRTILRTQRAGVDSAIKIEVLQVVQVFSSEQVTQFVGQTI